MELEDFITTTLASVMRGVSQAAKAHSAVDLGGFICPTDGTRDADFSRLDIRNVDFDVAVTVERSTGSKRGGKGSIKVIEGSLASEKGERYVGESRVRFSVPISFPSTRVDL